ncbi:MAG: hypothetical protein ACOCZ5_01505 [bacterium]
MKQTYYQKNKERLDEYAKRYQEEHYEKHKEHMRNYVRKNKDKVVEYNKEYKKKQYHSDEFKKLKQLFKTYHSLFMNENKPDFIEYVGLPVNEYKAYIESLLPKGYDWSNYRKKWRITHKNKELDVTSQDSIKKFFNYKNVDIEFFN